MTKQKLGILFLGMFFLSVHVTAQIGIKPWNENTTIKSYLLQHPNYVWNDVKSHSKWGIADTLNIPFFDDFSYTDIYPDSSKWLNNNVFVNLDFGINPPSFGVATFDFLDNMGKPYSSIEKESLEYGDTLTSQFINLGDSAGIAYTLDDSFYFSFFYQPRGRGDFITEDDSLKLLFRDKDGNWSQMWGVRGGTNYDFKQVLIPIHESRFLSEGFQFMFVNLTHRWGNNNHWHLDYVYLNKDRSKLDVEYDDYAIEGRPTSLLKNYSSMPYDHFLADPSEAADSIYFGVTNRNKVGINAEVRHEEFSDGNSLVSTLYSDNADNIPGEGFATRKLKSYSFTGLSGYPVVIEREYYVRESGRVNPALFQQNDKLTVVQEFRRHYAYDDGTPESGFGFNDLKSGDGRIVVEFDMKKADSLHAIDFMLTYNTQDVSRQRFVLQVYQDIAYNGGDDSLLFERSFIGQDIYDATDNRGFVTISLDSAISLPAGKFYVGWSQDRNFNLTVGFDKNNGNLKETGFNKHIYFNIGDGWIQNSNKALVGAPLIRPIVGAKDPFMVSVQPELTNPATNFYPNPASSEINFSAEVSEVSIRSLSGQEVSFIGVSNTLIDISGIKPGLYIISYVTNENKRVNAKFIKQ